MVIREGTCRFMLWHVLVRWDEDIVYQIRFVKKPLQSPGPEAVQKYLSGLTMTLNPLRSIQTIEENPYPEIYRCVSEIPYGETRTYGEIAELSNTHPRTVGMAMKRNITPLLIPCHRVVSVSGIGGFTPDPEIKKELLILEEKISKKQKHLTKKTPDKDLGEI